MSLATSFKRLVARETYAVVICFMHFATTPSTNLSIPLSLPALSPSSPSSGRGKGSIQTTCTGVGACEREKTSLSLPCGRQIPLLFNFVGKGSDARPPQSDLRSSSSPCNSTSLARGAMHIKRDVAIQTHISCRLAWCQ